MRAGVISIIEISFYIAPNCLFFPVIFTYPNPIAVCHSTRRWKVCVWWGYKLNTNMVDWLCVIIKDKSIQINWGLVSILPCEQRRLHHIEMSDLTCLVRFYLREFVRKYLSKSHHQGVSTKMAKVCVDLKALLDAHFVLFVEKFQRKTSQKCWFISFRHFCFYHASGLSPWIHNNHHRRTSFNMYVTTNVTTNTHIHTICR